MKKSLVQEIAITWEKCGGRDLSDAAMKSIKEDLAQFDSAAVRKALARCASECRGNISLADIVQRIDDGRPGAEEAWAMIPKTEEESAVWTSEMAEAYGIMRDLMEKDPVAARMAFKEAYLRICGEARLQGRPVEWGWSPGIDENFRARALLEAVDNGQFSAERAMSLAPHLIGDELEKRGFFLGKKSSTKMLTAKEDNDDNNLVPPEEIGAFVEKIATIIDLKEAADREVKQAAVRRREEEIREIEERKKSQKATIKMFEQIIEDGTAPQSLIDMAKEALDRR